MKHVFDSLPELKELILEAPHIALMLDYDGTLTSIVEKPELAILSQEARTILENISVLPNCTLCVVSGRPLEDIKNLVKLKDICYVGNHGLEASGGGIEYVNPIAIKTSDIIKDIHQELLRETENIPGVLLEYKHFTEALHYRKVPENKVQEVRDIFDRVTEPHLKKNIIKITENKKTLEVLPKVEWDKGKIVEHIISRMNRLKAGILPIYAGDDATDEDAFKALHGITILVSEHPQASYAQYYLKNKEEVLQFLEMLYLEKRK